MKKFSFFALAIAGMLFTACSDKDLAAGGEVGSQGEELPNGYMALNINLPVTPTVRAANDDFDHGLETEYKVSDCALLLFEGAEEETATLLNAQAIILPFDSEDPGDSEGNITTTYQATAQVKGHTTGAKLWALALLNYKNVMSIGDGGVPTFKEVVDGTATVAIGSTMADVRELVTKANLTTRGGSTNYFFMTNAVLSKVKGGEMTAADAPTATDIFQLAPMDPSKIKESIEEAKAEPAGEIFVERAVAKATLRLGDSMKGEDGEYYIDNKEGGLGLKISKVEWTIDNMEPSTYVTRNPGEYVPNEAEPDKTVNERAYLGYESNYFTTKLTKHNYRFVGNATLYGGTTLGTVGTDDIYRTYWCLDPQYNKEATGMLPALDPATGKPKATDVNYVTAKGKNDDPTPLYCYENTFDVERQSYKNTTRAIVKVTLADGATFYTLNGGKERYLQEDDVTSHVVAYIANKTAVAVKIKEQLKPGQESGEYAGYIHVGYQRDAITGQYKVNRIYVVQTELDEVTYVPDPEQPNTTASVFNDKAAEEINKVFTEEFISEINKEYVVREYKGGEIFYEARFKHFAGDAQSTPYNGRAAAGDLAPWNIKEANGVKNSWETTPSGGSTKAAYYSDNNMTKAANNYLGRYGMVRNNWYDVEITGIDKIGYPADPSGQVNNPDFDEPGTPDDNILEYISAKIHVLSWALRTQSWGF